MLRQASLATDPIRGAAQNLVGAEKLVLLDTLALENWDCRNGWLGSIRPFDGVRASLRPNRLIGAGPPVVPVTFTGALDTTNPSTANRLPGGARQ